MKRLTVDQTWEQCLAMWKWISRRCKKGRVYHGHDEHVNELKQRWLELNGFTETISQNCFFCDRTSEQGSCSFNCGLKCPGYKVDHDFDCTGNAYNFEYKPRLFYAELKRLNKIRLS